MVMIIERKSVKSAMKRVMQGIKSAGWRSGGRTPFFRQSPAVHPSPGGAFKLEEPSEVVNRIKGTVTYQEDTSFRIDCGVIGFLSA